MCYNRQKYWLFLRDLAKIRIMKVTIMKNIKRRRQVIMFLISAGMVVIQTAIFAFVWFHDYNLDGVLSQPLYEPDNYVLIGLYAALCILFFKLFGCFRVGYLRVYDMLFTQIGALLCINSFAYLQLCLTARWRLLEHITPMLVMTAVDLGFSLAWSVFSRGVYLKFSPPRELLLVYGEYSPDNLVRKLSSRPDKYHIREAISIETDMDEIKKKILLNGSVVLTDIPAEIRNEILKFCFAHDIRCYSVPKISDIMIMHAKTIDLFDTSLLLFRNHGLTDGQRFIKRVFDIVVSLIGLVVAAPFMLIIAICIKAYDGGPVFFTQDRLTLDGKVFKILKFRSMRVEKEQKGYCMTRKDDDRITPVGKILRNIHFDELPQLVNILKGDMSIVGPRPECPGLAAEYSQMIPEFPFRLKVKAGLTGYAQVYGKYNTTPYDKLKLDLTYIEKYSFLLDLELIVMTFKILFQKENTEGIEAWQTTAATEDNLAKLGKSK